MKFISIDKIIIYIYLYLQVERSKKIFKAFDKQYNNATMHKSLLTVI